MEEAGRASERSFLNGTASSRNRPDRRPFRVERAADTDGTRTRNGDCVADEVRIRHQEDLCVIAAGRISVSSTKVLQPNEGTLRRVAIVADDRIRPIEELNLVATLIQFRLELTRISGRVRDALNAPLDGQNAAADSSVDPPENTSLRHLCRLNVAPVRSHHLGWPSCGDVDGRSTNARGRKRDIPGGADLRDSATGGIGCSQIPEGDWEVPWRWEREERGATRGCAATKRVRARPPDDRLVRIGDAGCHILVPWQQRQRRVQLRIRRACRSKHQRK